MDKRLKEAELAARLHLAAIVDSADDAIISKTLDGVVLSWNKGAERMYGYSQVEMVGQPISTIVPEDRLHEVAEFHQKLRRGERIDHYETVRKTKDGTRVHVSLLISPIRNDEGEIIAASTIARDITSFKKDQERFRLVFEAAPSAMILARQDGTIQLVNRAAEAMFGYDRNELVHMTIEDLIPDRFRPHHDEHRTQFFKSPQARTMGAGRDLYGLRKDGSEVSIEIGLTPMALPDGQGVLASIIDITLRKTLEKNAAEFSEKLERQVLERTGELSQQRLAAVKLTEDISEAKLKAEAAQKKMRELYSFQKVLMDHAGTSIISTTTDGRITSFNKEAEKLLGYRADEVIGKVTPEIIHDRGEVEERAVEFSRQFNVKVEPGFEVFVVKSRYNLPNIHEWTYIHKDGTRFPVLLSVTALKDDRGEIAGYLGVATDITELKRMEKGFAHLSRAVEQSPVTVVITDTNGYVEYVNPAFEKNSGYTFDEIKGKHTRMLKSGEQTAQFYQKLWQTITAGEVWRGAFHNKKKSGELHWESASISPIKNKNGIITHFVAVKEDITEKKRREEQLKALANELKRSNAELEQFAYIASHDLQEPLRMVASYTQLLERRYTALLDDKGKEFIHFAVDGASRMQRLINDLLMFSRVGTQGKEFGDTDMNQVVTVVTKNLEILIHEKSVQIMCDALPVVWGDEGQLVQLLQNLIGNAIKFQGPQTPRIEIRGEEKAMEWLLSVADNGIGLDETYKDKVFDIFQRLHTRSEYEGTGIGLAVCKKIVERHGGTIWLKSKQGEGTTFYFTIPKNGHKKAG